MDILVIGAGVIGVTSAYFLAKSGHKVTVVDRQPTAANETSFANAGLVAPGHSYTWASPKAPAILWKSLFRNDQALQLRLSLDPKMWRWGLQFLGNCTAARTRSNTAHKVRLCRYSQSVLQEVAELEKIDYAQQRGGLLYLYRDAQGFSAGQQNMKILTDNGLDIQILDRDEVIRREPSLKYADASFAGALFCPTDESGDANLFTQGLAKVCESMGVTFLYNHTVKKILAEGNQIVGVETDQGTIKAEQYVLSAGSYSPLLVGRLGYKLPVYPVKGYSVTLPIEEHHTPPSLGGVDEKNLVAWARFKDRFRLTATADFSGYDLSHKPQDFAHMLSVAKELFPQAANYDEPRFWAGGRPMTPEGTPIISPTRHQNLFFNTGHGHMGWTMSCGSAKLLTSIINHESPEIDVTGMAFKG